MTESNEGISISSKIEQNDSCNVDGIAEKLQNSFIDDGADQSHYKSHSDRLQCRSPSEYNDVNHLFHIDFMRSIQSIPVRQKRYKNGTRISCTFSNEKMRQIERENKILLKKILAQRKNSDVRRSLTGTYDVSQPSSRVSSASINRRQQQERIDFDNLILKKKIEKISQKGPKC